MFRFKLSWILAVVTFLIWSVVIFKLSAFAAVEEPVRFVWTAQTQPMAGTPAVIEMKPTMLAPKGMPPAPMRSLLTRVLGKSLGGLIPSAGIVYQVMDLEGRRQSVAYAIDQLMKNGQPVTPQTIQEWIAQQNGISTNGVSEDYDASDGYITSTDSNLPVALTYEVGSLQASNVYNLYSDINTRTWCYDHGYNLHPGFGAIYNRMGPKTIQTPTKLYVWQDYLWSTNYSVNYNRYKTYPLISYSAAPDAFDPANYPEIFGPDFFPSQALDALVAQGLDSFDIVLDKVNADLDDHVFVDVAAKYPTPETEWTEVYASNGLTYRIPIGALGGSVVPQYQAPSNSVEVQTDTGQTTLSNAESKPFIDAGVPQGARIVRVDPKTGTVTYVDPATGQTKTAQVPKTDAANLTNNYNVYNTVNNSTDTTNIHQEIKLPEVHVSGEIKVSNGTLEPVSQDRVEASRNRFQTSWNNLKQTFADMFTVNLTGIGRLPVWNWPMLGHVIVIDFNVYAQELNWLGLAFLFFATISAIFIVINH